MRWRSRKTLFYSGALSLLLLALGFGFACVSGMSSLNRAANLGIYCGALRTYVLLVKDRTVPDDIEQFVTEYNSLAGRGQFPRVSDFPLPEFRPVREVGEGPFLVLIESPPLKWYDFGRWVIYTDGNYRQVELREVSSDELPMLKAEDDELRRRARATATSSAPGAADQAE